MGCYNQDRSYWPSYDASSSDLCSHPNCQEYYSCPRAWPAPEHCGYPHWGRYATVSCSNKKRVWDKDQYSPLEGVLIINRLICPGCYFIFLLMTPFLRMLVVLPSRIPHCLKEFFVAVCIDGGPILRPKPF